MPSFVSRLNDFKFLLSKYRSIEDTRSNKNSLQLQNNIIGERLEQRVRLEGSLMSNIFQLHKFRPMARKPRSSSRSAVYRPRDVLAVKSIGNSAIKILSLRLIEHDIPIIQAWKYRGTTHTPALRDFARLLLQNREANFCACFMAGGSVP